MGDDLNDDLIKHIRGRIEKCRRLASSIADETAQRALLDMAAEGEADLRRLEARRDAELDETKPATVS